MKARMTLVWLVGGLALLGSASPAHPVRLVWNRTNSVPGGLYIVHPKTPDTRFRVGDMVAFSPPPETRAWLEKRAYTGKDWLLVKKIAALSGDTVCRTGPAIRINQRHVALALQRDAAGRPLPDWQGCYTLGEGDVFLLAEHPGSLDGRYMGIQRTVGILGKTDQVLSSDRPDPT